VSATFAPSGSRPTPGRGSPSRPTSGTSFDFEALIPAFPGDTSPDGLASPIRGKRPSRQTCRRRYPARRVRLGESGRAESARRVRADLRSRRPRRPRRPRGHLGLRRSGGKDPVCHSWPWHCRASCPARGSPVGCSYEQPAPRIRTTRPPPGEAIASSKGPGSGSPPCACSSPSS
jgi:hypothetical protein